jgi:hypothetical protein
MEERMNRPLAIAFAAVLLVLGGVLYYWNTRDAQRPPAPLPPPAEAPVASSAPETKPAIEYPIEAPADAESHGPLPPLARADEVVRKTLVDWLGKDAIVSFLQLDDFVRHVVATTDNLGRSHAAPRLWPVNPIPGKFNVIRGGEDQLIAPGNAERYAPFVVFVESIDTKRAVDLYVRWYPWFQQAYEELGYPGRHFNDRLVNVIDRLIATPVPEKPLAVTLTDVKGPIASTRPWVRYEFADPALESLSAGQKMLLRVGPTNQRRLQAKLVDFRRQLTARSKAR